MLNTLDVKRLTLAELLGFYCRLKAELVDRGIIRSENLVGDYAEFLLKEKLDLALEAGSTRGIDARDSNGKTYQIKARKWSEKATPTIKALRSFDFDYLALVIFNHDYSVKYCGLLTPEQAKGYSKHNPRVNGYRISITRTLMNDKAIRQIQFE